MPRSSNDDSCQIELAVRLKTVGRQGRGRDSADYPARLDRLATSFVWNSSYHSPSSAVGP
jgi:hypothetical protein